MAEKFEIIKQAYEKIIEATNLEKVDLRRLREIFRPVAEAYGAAEVITQLIFNGQSVKTIYLYRGDGCRGTQTVEFTGRTRMGKVPSFIWVCRSDMSWSEKDVDDIMFLCRISYTLSAKIRLTEMTDKFYFHDTATGLLNLNGLKRFAVQLAEDGIADRYTAAFINIIGFNYINKKVGYDDGTKIIKTYGNQIKKSFDRDEVIARLGGDNFVIFYKNENEEKVKKLLNGIKVCVKQGGTTIAFTLRSRAGIYRITDPHAHFGEIMGYISAAFNYSRTLSRTNQVFYVPAIEQQMLDRKEYVQRFSAALENGDFFVVYQPKVNSGDDSIYGGEALVRWNCDGRVIPPGEFVEILEKEHLVCSLDYYVLEQTCKNLRRWIDSGIKPVKISVNFSNEHLYEDNLVEKITEIPDRYGIDHDLIEIEMTETADVYETKKLLAYVDGLHKNGFTVAIDDFGIGYSSLHLLQSVAVDVLKIDKAFVSEVGGDKDKRENVILKHIINMAAELGIEIVAEGVETDKQRQKLKEMNCHRIQGYIYDKPLMQDEFLQRITVKNYTA